MKTDGALYVFEGPDSVGKTSLARLFSEHLISTGVDCILLAFPGRAIGTVGNLIYTLHHEPERLGVKALSPTALQMLHVAAHIDAIETKILPALALGQTVILDRFWWSTDVYGQLDDLDEALLNSIIRPELHIWGQVIPTAVFLLERNTPFEFDISEKWVRCASLYSRLADKQEKVHRVHRIYNNSAINTALSTIAQATKI